MQNIFSSSTKGAKEASLTYNIVRLYMVIHNNKLDELFSLDFKIKVSICSQHVPDLAQPVVNQFATDC